MNIENLIKMANEIASFFEGAAEGEEEAASAIADHFKRFWEPRMRRELIAYLEETNGQGLKESVVRAIRTHRDYLYGTQAIKNPTSDLWRDFAGGGDAG